MSLTYKWVGLFFCSKSAKILGKQKNGIVDENFSPMILDKILNVFNSFIKMLSSNIVCYCNDLLMVLLIKEIVY